MGQEIELKLTLDEKALARLPACEPFAHVEFSPTAPKKLRATYFDSAANTLRQKGVVLRLRDEDGRLIQTLKGKKAFGSLAAGRAEFESRIPKTCTTPDFNRLPPDLKQGLQTLLNGNNIEPLFVTDVDRTIGMLTTDAGDSIELALDRGFIRAGRRETKVSELELELKKGDPASLYRVALELAETVPVRIGVRTKGERGYALANALGPKSVKGELVQLPKKASVEQALELVLRHCLAHIVANEPALVETADEEALHQMRVGLRRLRAALAVFAPVLDKTMMQETNAKARTLAGLLGVARDYDVFRGELVAPLKESGNESIKVLDRAATLEQINAWDAGLRAVSSTEFTRTCLSLALHIEEKSWRRRAEQDPTMAMMLAMPAQKFAERALTKRLKKAKSLGENIDHLKLSERHELRKRLKSLKYAVGFFASLYPKKPVTKHIKKLSALQDVFGSLNDLAVAEEIIRTLIEKSENMPNQLTIASGGGRVLGWHGAQADTHWTDASDAWASFRSTAPFWRT
ncbi:MAG: CHAD domain-containing protein [Parvibaculaceae bacterium]|nr:CHAD domain-containing protein [Parvibaculaceae bacterium]